VVIDDLDIRRSGIPFVPGEADAPLQIDPDTPLAFAPALQSLEPVARQRPKIAKAGCGIKNPEPFASLIGKRPKRPDIIAAAGEDFAPPITKADDHDANIIALMDDVKRQ